MGFFDVLVLACRVAQFVFAVIVLGTAARVASLFTGAVVGGDGVFFQQSAPSQLGFILFCAVWSILVVAWQLLTPRYAQKLAHRFVILGLDALTMLFWFAGFIALAVFTGVPYGPTPDDYKTLQAAVAFGAFSWVAFLITTVLSAIDIFRSRGGPKHNPELENAA